MKRFAAIFGLCAAAFCQTQLRAQEKTSNAPVSVTGCISQGDEANEYAIKDSTGKTYGLVRSKVNIKSHIGHTVTITGTPVKENEAKEQKEHEKSGKAEESEHLQVTDLKMVSTSCK
jgi:hypothetical protein